MSAHPSPDKAALNKAHVTGFLTAIYLVRRGLELMPVVDRRRALNVVDSILRGAERAHKEVAEQNGDTDGH